MGPRRSGDVVAIFANNDLARRELKWEPEFNLDDMMLTAWKWEVKRKAEDQKNKQIPGLN